MLILLAFLMDLIMVYKTSFWTPKLTNACLVPPVFSLCWLFGAHGPENSEGATIAETIPSLLRPVYYVAAASVVLAAFLLGAIGFLLGSPFTLLHDSLVKLGDMSGCERDNSFGLLN